MLKVYRKFFSFCGGYSHKFYYSLGLGIIRASAETLQLPAIAVILQAALTDSMSIKTILLSLLLMAASIILKGILQGKMSMLQTEAGYGIAAEKRIDIADHMRYVPLGYFNQNSLGRTTSVATNTMEILQELAPMCVLMTLQGFISVLVFALVLIFYSWKAGLIVVAAALLFVAVNSIIQKKSAKIAPHKSQIDERLVSTVLDYIQGIGVIKSFSLDKDGNSRVKEEVRRNDEMNYRIEKSFTPLLVLQSIVLKAGSVGILLLSIIVYLSDGLPLLDCLLLMISSFFVFGGLEKAGGYATMLRMVDVAVDKVNEAEQTPVMDQDGQEISPSVHGVAFEHVSFGYGKKRILDDVSFRLPDKKTLALVGPSGSGKTTICSLTNRFWDADGGRVLVGGIDVRDYKLDSLMAQVSMVFQDVYLFDDTIENNIRFGCPDATRQEVEDAAKAACCHSFITTLSDGYDTMVGEGGASLSGGEKQRISIARAILKNASIVILDEATASVDPENENELLAAIEKLMQDKTVIMIAHRLKTVEKADEILVLDKGRIIQRGTHNQLINEKDGLYYRFVTQRQEAAGWKLK